MSHSTKTAAGTKTTQTNGAQAAEPESLERHDVERDNVQYVDPTTTSVNTSDGATRDAGGKPTPSPDASQDNEEESVVEVLEVSIASGIEHRRPTGVGTSFPYSVRKVWCWVMARNSTRKQTKITAVWNHKGKAVYKIKLNVGVGKGWRTWSYMKIGAKHVGPWNVQLLGPEGTLLREVDFTITGIDGKEAEFRPGDVDAILGDPPDMLE